MRLRCTACKYEFEPRNKDATTLPNRCPYCSKEGTVDKKKHALEEL